jgi:hypothetical protein
MPSERPVPPKISLSVDLENVILETRKLTAELANLVRKLEEFATLLRKARILKIPDLSRRGPKTSVLTKRLDS